MYKYIHKFFLTDKFIYNGGLFKPLDNLCHLLVEDNFSFPLDKKHLDKASIIFDELSSDRERKPEGDRQTYHDLRTCNKLAASLSEKDAELVTNGEHDEIRAFFAKNPEYVPLDEFLEDFFEAIMWDYNCARSEAEWLTELYFSGGS